MAQVDERAARLMIESAVLLDRAKAMRRRLTRRERKHKERTHATNDNHAQQLLRDLIGDR